MPQRIPRQIERAEFRDGDWAVLLRGAWYYYADGRLLPEHLRDSAETQSRSYHSYGLAADLIPASWGGRETSR